MAELDKFVLEYQVEIRDSLARLEKLDKSVAKVKGASDKAKSSLKGFAADAGQEIGKLVPGIDKVSAAIRAMGAEFGLAGLAIGTLAASIAAIAKTRAQYNQQRREGNEVGVDPVYIEDAARKLRSSKGGGNVSREQSDALFKRAAEMNTEVRTDPTGATARNLLLKGLNTDRGPNALSTLERLQELQDRFRKEKDSRVISESKSFGIDPDIAVALKNAKNISEITNHSTEELQNRLSTADSLNKLNDQTAKLDTSFDLLRQNVGEALIPAVTKFVDFINNNIKVSKPGEAAEPTTSDTVSNPRLGYAGKNALDARNKRIADAQAKDAGENSREMKALLTKQDDAAARNIKAQFDLRQKEAEDQQRAKNENAAIVSQFAASVAAFGDAIDMNQALAAWAGAAGKASGMPTAGPVPKPGNTGALDVSNGPAASTEGGKRSNLKEFADKANAPGKLTDLSKYDPIIEEAAKKNDIPLSLAKAIIHTESKGRPSVVSSAGNVGLTQISPEIAAKYGVTDPTDPKQNVNAGLAEFAWFRKRAHGDVRQALQWYNGGFDSKKYGPQNAAYSGKVLAAQVGYETQIGKGMPPILSGVSTGGEAPRASAEWRPTGYDRDSIMRTRILAQFSQGLGVPITQIAQGGVNRGDMERERDILNAGFRNQIAQTLNDAKNPMLTQAQSVAMMRQAADQARGIDALKQFAPGLIANAQEGPRALTVGANAPGSTFDQLALTINVNGAGDPHAVAKEIEKVLSQHINDIHNGAAQSAVK